MINISLQSLKVATTSLLFFVSINTMAASCLDVFPTVLSSSASNGKAEFEQSVVLNGTNGSIDIEVKKDATTNSNPSCVSQKCVDSTNRAKAFILPPFQQSNSREDHTINNGNTLSLDQGSYDKIKLNYQATVRFTQNNEVTFIKKLEANTETTIIFEAGVYWIDNFNIDYKTNVVINGSDKVTLIINSSNFNNATEVSFNVSGTPEQLVLIAYENLKFAYKAGFKGFIYANKNIELANESNFEGAINADDIKLKYKAAITYAPNSIESANFNSFCTVSSASDLTGNLNVDNTFEAYLSTNDSVQGTFLTSGTDWPTTYVLASSLTAGQDYYLHIKGTDLGGVAGFLGDFEITGTDHTFSNGLTTLTTNKSDWVVSTVGWNNYKPASTYGVNGVAPWGTRSDVDASAQWIWSSNNNAHNENYFSTKIISPNICSNTLNAVGIKIGGEWWHDRSLGNTSEALAIYAAWLDAGSPASGSIDNNTYYVTASGSSSVDRIDFGGSEHDFTGTLPYPGVSGEDFLVHTSGTLSLPAGDYTIYVESDDGFSFVMNTLSGDTVSFNKFGNSNSGDSNELRYERPTSNSNTGGSFTLSQDSVFDIAAIFFERGGQDFLEISIANDIRTNAAPNGYQILRDGALNGKVKFGECSTPSQIDHYEISHDGNGVTCAASLITVTAHDANHAPVNVLNDTSLTVTTNPSVDSIISSPVIISAGTSSASFYLNQGSPLSNIDIDVTDGAASDPDDAGTEDPVINFLDTAFRFYVNGSHTDSTAIGTQIAGKPSGTAPGNQTLTLGAVRTNTDTGACEAALEGTTAVELAYECNDPTTCTASDLLSLTGVNTATISRNDNAVTPKSYSSVNMKFDANGIAPFSFNFSDAGKITLYARKTVAAKSPQPSFTLLGQSNKFVTRPFAFHIDVPDNPSATNANEGKFKKAGESFTTTLTAKLWQASDDNNNDGKPDSNNALSDNSVTPNFGNEVTPATANLTHTLVLPISGNNPPLLNNSFSNFNSGISSRSDLSWAEVGIIEFNAELSNNNYLGATDVTGNVPYVGRFTPDHFTLSSSSVSYASSGLMDMSYMDQPNLLLSYTLEARNANDVITKNYQGVFAKATVGIQAENNNDGTNLSTRLSGGGSNWIGGIYSQANATWTFHRAAVEDGPYDNLLLAISISDTIDNVPLEGLNINVNTADPNCAPNCTAKVLNSTKSIVRFGRWILENSYGPETIALRVPMQTQYWDGNAFVTNNADSFTTFSSSSASISNNALIPSPVANPTISGNGTFNNGESKQLILSSPGAGKHGSVDVTFDVPNWLKFDWNNGGLYNENPSAQVNFGLYRGNDRIIYRREVFE
ncbi:DUF6701 domain-containing protein [Psychromonas antarctica]|uniref:DUF6701 domain-containing protein n=1 Tax=Psychromonas antarctica TaxID=67573 RepID=UPI001EE92276|nr:DUF6701 domain-containing protein [Psychromonas antarctica]MCG6199698.1 hypothetical protein [Psychromonas antarctica]